MAEFSERTLGSEAIEYIRKRLETGKTFAQHLLKELDLPSGEAFTYLPDDVSDEGAHQFQWDGKLPQPDESTWRRWTDDKGRKFVAIPTPNTGD